MDLKEYITDVWEELDGASRYAGLAMSHRENSSKAQMLKEMLTTDPVMQAVALDAVIRNGINKVFFFHLIKLCFGVCHAKINSVIAESFYFIGNLLECKLILNKFSKSIYKYLHVCYNNHVKVSFFSRKLNYGDVVNVQIFKIKKRFYSC